MKLKIKEINLKEETLKNINDNNDSVVLFINRIKEYLDNANMLINQKIINFTDEEFYDNFSKVFDFIVEKKDYIKVLSKMYHKHYTEFINIHTFMEDKLGYISYIGVVTKEYSSYDGMRLSLDKIRKLTNDYDFLVLEKEMKKITLSRKDKVENHQYINVDVNSEVLDINSNLFPYFIELLREEIDLKDVLYELKWYIKEVMAQARSITDMSKDKNEVIANIGKRYSLALKNAFNEKDIPKREKVSVRKHKKRSK